MPENKNFLTLQNRMVLLLGFVVIVSLILLGIYTFFSKSKVQPQPVPIPSPSVPLPQPYNLKDLDRDYKRITTRQSLSAQDKVVRDKLLKSLNFQSGIVKETDLYKIEYVKSPDAFMVEIKGNDTESVKSEVSDWFKAQGLSQEGICNLPVVFYLSQKTSDYLKGHNLIFNPVPAGC